MDAETVEVLKWVILFFGIGVFLLWPGVIRRLMTWFEHQWYKMPAGRRGYSPDLDLLFIKWFLRLSAASLLIIGLAAIIFIFLLPRILGK